MVRLLAATVMLIGWAAECSALTYYSYAFGDKYEVDVSRAALRKSPAWKEDAENPPLSARKAIRLANEKRVKVVKDRKSYAWQFRSAALVRGNEDDRWFWLVSYEAVYQGPSSGVPHSLQLVVLMDGVVIEPLVNRPDCPEQIE